jgi:hypothetical protein
VVATQLLLVTGVLHECGPTVLFETVEVDLARLFRRALFIVLDARSVEGKVGGEDGL